MKYLERVNFVARTDSLTRREVEGVLDLLTEGNRLVMRTALHTGLRVGDVLALKTAQIRPKFWITEQKTGKKRQVGLPAALRADILAEAGPVWAFPGRYPDKPRTRQAVWKDIKRAAKALRLPVNVGTHSARKTYAVELLRRTGDLEQVQRALNHDRLETALIYAMADHRRKKRRRRNG